MLLRSSISIALVALGFASTAQGIIFLETADPAHHTLTPGDNSGWQYEGKFREFLGVPIAPYFFITAKHIGGAVGDVLDFHGDIYTTIAIHPSPDTDLQIWEVDHAKPFPTFAPLASSAGDTGTVATIIGRGTQKGAPVMVNEMLKGWAWGAGDNVERWGRNEIEGVLTGNASEGELLYCNFNSPGIPDECHLSVGDSGGGMFVLEGGLWRLAGVNYAVEGPFRTDPAGIPFNAALFDIGGLEEQDGPEWTPVVDGSENVPSGFLCSRISASLSWIRGVTGDDSSLPMESFSAWQKLYFAPTQIAAEGAMADNDSDGVPNLLEFAFNLDPTFAEPRVMEPETGIRGIPVSFVETISGEAQLTIVFLRRTAASGAGLIYQPEFSTDLVSWTTGGTETATAINDRWERVKVVAPTHVGEVKSRFTRVRVSLAP